MKKHYALLLVPLLAVAFSSLASADDQPIYKWTDAQGVLHYSDKPPKDASVDVQTLDLPPLPPQDPAKIAAAEAAQAAGTTALLQELQAQTLLQQQQVALAAQQAELQDALGGPEYSDGDVESVPMYPIYAHSPSIPRAYRRNLYLSHRIQAHAPAAVNRPGSGRASIAVIRKP